MGRGEAADKEEMQADKRITWMEQRINACLKLRQADMKKFLENEDNRNQFTEFLDVVDTKHLFVYPLANGTYIARVEPPEEMKKKGMYFAKNKSRDKITDENTCRQIISFGDLNPDTLDSLNVLTKNFYMPLISKNRANTATVPDVARPEFMEATHNFMAQILVTLGLSQGKTLLPIPPIQLPARVDEAPQDKDLLYQLESAIVSWTAQIRAAMQNSPEEMVELAAAQHQHAGPQDEVAFWKTKSENLSYLEEQIHTPKILKVIVILKKAGSSYYPPFSSLLQELKDASVEARDNYRFLKPLATEFEAINPQSSNKMEFDQLVPEGVFKKLFHFVYLLWTNSAFYNTPSRLVVLIREMCNDLIGCARENVNVADLFTGEPAEAMNRLSQTLATCGHFKAAYFSYKSKAAKTSSPWKFQNTALFSRLDAFLERCHDLLDLLETANLFASKDQMKIGGTNGVDMTTQAEAVRAEFTKAYVEFQAVDYDLLNVDEPRFDVDYGKFRATVRDLELRMASMLSNSIQDARSFGNLFKTVDTFDGFTDRAIVAQEWSKRQMDALAAYHADLLDVQETFNKQREFVAAYPNMPPTATSLIWARALMDRIHEPHDHVMEMSKAVLESELGVETLKLYSALVAALKSYVHQSHEAWASNVSMGTEKLKANLLVKDDNGKLAVNFDPQLVKTLREVNYIEILNSFEPTEDPGFTIPPQAAALFKQQETYRSHVLKLDFVTTTYNNFMLSMRDEDEKPLLRQELELFEAEMAKGLRELQWQNGEQIDEFINGVMQSVTEIDAVVSKMHGNLKSMQELIQGFIKEDKFLPLNPAKGDKTMSEADFRKKLDENTKHRKTHLSNCGTQIHTLLAETLGAINELKTSSGSPVLDSDTEVWCHYVEYVNGVVRDLVCESVVHSLKRLRDQLSIEWLEANEGIPLLEVRLILTRPKESSGERPETRFDPNLSNREGAAQSVDSLINEIISNINTTATYISRLDTGDAADNYLSEVLEHKDANQLAKQINELLAHNTEQCQTYLTSFNEFRHLYETDMRAQFHKFIKADEEPAADQNDSEDKTEPTEYFGVPLAEYDKAICEYEKIAERIVLIEERRGIGFLRIDVKPIRSALADVCRRWKEMYSGHLTTKIHKDLTDLNEFIAEADKGLDQEVLDGNLESLKSVMRHIRDCRKRHTIVMGVEGKTNGMFPPIQAAVQMLKDHPLADNEASTLEQLDEMRKPAPEAWNNLFKKSLTVRAQNSLVQDREAEKIKDQMTQFDDRLLRISQEFKDHKLFTYENDIQKVYDDIDKKHGDFLAIEEEAKALRNLQELFDLTPSEFKELRDCRSDLVMLKHMWDLIAHIRMTFADWMKSTFKAVDTDSFNDELKKMKDKLMKNQPVKAKAWACFRGLEAEWKNMFTALPLCGNLRSDAMRDRHWQLLLQTTKAQGHIDPDADDFTLQKLIDLGLHRYEEDVNNIVEKATKELSIEKALTKIIDIWGKMTLTYDYHETLDTFLLGPIDEIVEQLEIDNNTLQGMLSNRFVEFFFEKVTLWQRNLGSVDTCINKWMEIQRQWMNLFPIFVLSADIKEQLPDDAKNFQVADDMFRALMSKAHKYTNVVEVVCTDVIKTQLNKDQELEEMLVFMQDILTQCEKALTEYLETKRKIFPRFYFVSATDLIDILSKGSDPRAVMVHMSKIVDSIDTFSLDGNPNQNAGPKDVYNIVSVQGEVVSMPKDFTCDGPVEDWLNGCISAMQQAIRFHIQEANAGYTDKPRVEWIYSYPCQAIIVASRIWFTNEVHQAFGQLEEGNDGGMKECLKNQRNQLDNLIKEVLLDKNSNDRKMLVHLITIDVHSRDIVQGMVDDKIDAVDSFNWQSQLRYYWDEKKGSEIRICDAEFINAYEYIGLCGCLVITKLTDRCYITLSQALRLKKGGAPAGPAGTGKTETTKDLARNLGVACYVFNCSDQMNYLSLGQIFKGLAMSGSWGCFDEFNRISIEVLSVVATQVGSILNALKAQKKRFRFMDEEIPIIPSVGMWITMNPGYAGRTELPENIKSLFRPCAMCVPDLKNICEIMLAAEGFIEAKDLALKFVTLYRLNRELLSPQRHYDWGLRAVKSVLYIAGALKRGDPELPERNVLMRALRDTNMAKLSKDDVFVFMSLIQALFPRLEVPKKEKPELVDACKAVCKEMNNLCGENDIFILKCVQYEELLHVRHSVFILGPAGCGKTQCWRCLQGALTKLGDRCQTKCLNPKAITSNELYGYFHPQTKEWKDGILSSIFRDFAVESKTKKNSKWIVLDGIIDAEWIESMNTVMDDNKMLTLVSNERIPLTSSMRMIFEISHLANASPATVSRAGVVFINESDLGWGPFKDKWLMTRIEDKDLLDQLFDKYVGVVFDFWKRVMRPVVSVMDINIVQTICFMLEGMLTENAVPKSAGAQMTEVYEKIFCFAVVWAFGGCLPGHDGRVDMRQNFSNIWRKEFPAMKMADNGTVFDFYIDTNDYEWKPWSTLVEKYTPDPDEQLSNVTVQTADTVRMSFLMSLFVDRGRPVMLVGTAGTGKTNLIMSKLRKLDSANIVFRVVSFNARTSSAGLQAVMEANLEKRGGKSWGPLNRKKLVFFFDDMNMPEPDKYGTQEAIALIQQHYSYGFWYDRAKIGPPKEVVDLRYIGAMNPKSGTFTILDRLLRHFALFATNVPDKADLVKIYGQILQAHLSGFGRDVRDGLSTAIVNATIDLHTAVTKYFLPTAIKFHYQWNMREMFNVFQGLCKSNIKLHNDALTVSRLWLHECARTFRDRMVEEADMKKYDSIVVDAAKQISEVPQDELMKEPLLWAPFTTTKDGEEGVYDQTDVESSYKYINQRLAEYNENYARMDLVLFTQAIEHVCRICRITSNPRGNALLVGVGGSGKQSLAKLASFINGQETFQILVTSTYGINDFRTDMQELYRKSGVKGLLYGFILTDSQIVNLDMLVYLNDMLSSGNVPEMFNQEERDGVIGSVINEVKQTGHPDYANPDVCWDYFINKVRTNMHIILCFSPVGQQFAKWCRQFPALSNTTVIDWFHSWPEDALRSVANRFLSEIDLESDDMTKNIAEFMARCQASINEEALEYFRVEKRRCYTTPKSFLELISLYKSLLAKKRAELDEKVQRLETGIEKIREAGDQVSALQEVLKRESVEVEEARMKTSQLMEHVGKEKAIVQEQNEIAEVEEAKTNKIVVEVEGFQAECQRDLAAAQPLVEKALAALNTLDKNSLTELKSMGKPPDDVVMVACAVKVLTSDPKSIPPPKNRNWAEAKKMMANVTAWLKELQAFDCNNIPQACIDALEPYVNNPAFDPNAIATKSAAASGLCAWVNGMNEYHKVRCDVKPKEEKLAEATARLETSKAQLKKVQDRVADLKARLDTLLKQYNDAVDAANAIEAKAKKTRDKADLATRLVGGLGDENKRWEATIKSLKLQARLLIGDVLLGSAFISYIGPFSKAFRERIVNDSWLPAAKELGIPMTNDLDIVMNVLTTEAIVASWNNDGLPSDRVSTENGSIVTNCSRWPLMIDPQLQAVKWIRTREERNGLKVIQTGGKGWLNTLANCIEEGLPCLLESLGENIEPILDNILGRVTFKKGGKLYCKLGATDVEYNPKFRFYLQTKLGNPFYKPEVNAQTTLINFMVTESGLEDQLLAVVVNQERPDLEEKRVSLIRSMNTMTIDLQQCEDGLLYELTNAKGDILENVTLVENLEATKKKAKEINASMEAAVTTQKTIAMSRLTYTNVAVRGSLLFFQIDQLCKIDHMYQYSLEAFMVVFNKALGKAEQPEDKKDVTKRVEYVLKSITETVFAYVSRGLFERHKLIFSSLLCFAILNRRGDIDRGQLDFLLRGKKKPGIERPEAVAEWCPEANWAAVQALAEVEGATPSYEGLPADMGEHNRWRQWAESEKPEEEKLPTDWKNLTPFQKLLVLRCLRPDRLTSALETFVADSIGRFFVSDQAVNLSVSFKDSGATTPLFFILSAGVDPVRAVEALGQKMNITYDNEKLHNVSLGQGQEIVAERALEVSFEKGGWAMLNNIHLVAKWLLKLEKKLDAYSEIYTKMAQIAKRKAEKRAAKRAMLKAQADEEQGDKPEEEAAPEAAEETAEEPKPEGEEAKPEGEEAKPAEAAEAEVEEEAEEEDEEEDDDPELKMDGPKGHWDFRVFLSAEPSDVIPIGILQRSIKLTSEPPTGIAANVNRALTNFSDEPWERSNKPAEYRAIMFSMCFFHAVVVERKKFGPQGWNRVYPFNVGDLTTCLEVTANYIDERPKVPWEDLRYVFGEIMYGGHITDDWDRVLCMAYLQSWIVPESMDGLELAPGLAVPPPMNFQEYQAFVTSESMPPESPLLYGLHPNAEINFRTVQADVLFKTINELQPKQQTGGAALSTEDVVRQRVQDISERLPEPHNLAELSERLEEERSPQQHVFYQECERMNQLIATVKATLAELDLGLKGALSMTSAMQRLADEIFMDKLPDVWALDSFMSMRPLPSWFENFQQRNQQLLEWIPEMTTPKVTMISYFFNPMSFLTAIMQTMSIQNAYDLDQMSLVVDVLKKAADQIDTGAREGCHVYGIMMEGARWDVPGATIEDSKMKELYPRMPVMTIRSLPLSKIDRKDQYECPMYKTQARGPGFVVGLFLKSKAPARKWVIAGVGVLLDVVE